MPEFSPSPASSNDLVFAERREAGRLLGAVVRDRLGADAEDALVLAVPRGGVVVGAEVARALGAPLDLMVARKVGAPHQPELAIGAVVSGDAVRFRDEPAIRALRVSEQYLVAEMERQLAEIQRRLTQYRGERPPPKVAGRCIILVDDGVATGYTLRAALAALRAQHPARLVLAVPVGPPSVLAELERLADEVIYLLAPVPFIAVGRWYADFEQTSDNEVTALLAENHAAVPSTE